MAITDNIDGMPDEVVRLALIGASTELERARIDLVLASRRASREAGALREELDGLRAELDTLKASTVPTGWIKIGNWAHAHPDGMLVRKGSFGCWVAEDANGTWTGVTAIDAARAAGRFDFPGAAEPTP